MQDSKRQNRRKADTGVGAKTESPVCTVELEKAMRDGLRILARIIARSHLQTEAEGSGTAAPDQPRSGRRGEGAITEGRGPG